jgi:hypothetical protein
VVAIAPYACTEYYKAIPLVVSPSDKTEKWESLAEWVSNFVKNYTDHPFGEEITRKIYALASDGDATFHRAKHKICMTTLLDPQSDLGNELSGLLGLNLFTLQDVMLGTCNPKHIMKSTHIYIELYWNIIHYLNRICNPFMQQIRSHDLWDKYSSWNCYPPSFHSARNVNREGAYTIRRTW